jgi:hypothetical protein
MVKVSRVTRAEAEPDSIVEGTPTRINWLEQQDTVPCNGQVAPYIEVVEDRDRLLLTTGRQVLAEFGRGT